MSTRKSHEVEDIINKIQNPNRHEREKYQKINKIAIWSILIFITTNYVGFITDDYWLIAKIVFIGILTVSIICTIAGLTTDSRVDFFRSVKWIENCGGNSDIFYGSVFYWLIGYPIGSIRDYFLIKSLNSKKAINKIKDELREKVEKELRDEIASDIRGEYINSIKQEIYENL